MKNASNHKKSYITVQELFYPEEYPQVSAPYEDDSSTTNNNNNNTDNIPIAVSVVAIDEDDINLGRNSRWDVVWAEVQLLSGTSSSYDSNNRMNSNNNNNNNNSNSSATLAVPQVAVVPSNPVYIDPPQQELIKVVVVEPNLLTPPGSVSDTAVPVYCHYHNPIEIIVGISIALTAVLATLSLEITTVLVYITATTLYTTAHIFRRNHSIILGFVLHICAFVFMIITYTLMMIDVILLITSIIITEVLALLAGLFTTLMTCCNIKNGTQWQQYIRKICHLSRWAFRNDIYTSMDKEPKRMFGFVGQR